MAHDDKGVRENDIRAVGNFHADRFAGEAAAGIGKGWRPDARYADAVRLKTASGAYVHKVPDAVTRGWWEQQRRTVAVRRAWIARLYPAGMDFDWDPSQVVFRPPRVVEGKFVHILPQMVVKWTARARAGALATGARRAKTHSDGSVSPVCVCCAAPLEDDEHAILVCPVTGAGDWLSVARRVWRREARRVAPLADPLTVEWLNEHAPQVATGLIPLSIHQFVRRVPGDRVPSLLNAFHKGMVERLAEVLRSRAARVAEVAPPAPTRRSFGAVSPVAKRAPERVLTTAELREAERRPLPPAALPVGRDRSGRAQASLRERKRAAAL